MDVIVPMAGHSRRYAAAGWAGPKALLPVDGAPMIQRVLEMFAPHDRFHVIVHDGQLAEDPTLRARLESLGDVVVHSLPPHEDGPVRSVLAVTGLPDDAPVVVCYCDFLLRWDAEAFYAHWAGAPGAVVTFRGFQPASFGPAMFAHCRVDGDRMLELREKECFTADRRSEHASAGVYAFDSWARLRSLSEQRLARPRGPLECYVSLLLQDLVEDGETVVVHEVPRFACLGTPQDYAQYLAWGDAWGDLAPAAPVGATTTALIPLAGRGQRFADAGFTTPKPLIAARGVPMAVRAARSLPATRRRFGLRAEDEAAVRPPLAEAFPDAEFVVLPGETSGQAATCLAMLEGVDPAAPLLIGSGDYEQPVDAERWAALVADESIDAAVWTVTPGAGLFAPWTAYAWCRQEDGRLTELVEKRTISDDPRQDPLVIGTFWFRRAADFARGARAMIAAGITVNGEHYVGTSINQLVAEGLSVAVFEVDRWTCFGTPFELALHDWWADWFGADD